MVTSLFGLLVATSTLYEQRFNRNNENRVGKFKKGHLDYDVMKAEKMHSINNGNGQHFELQQIAIENNNESRSNTNMQNGIICQPKNVSKTNGDKMNGTKENEKCEQSQSMFKIDVIEWYLFIWSNFIFCFRRYSTKIVV